MEILLDLRIVEPKLDDWETFKIWNMQKEKMGNWSKYVRIKSKYWVNFKVFPYLFLMKDIQIK